MWLQPFAKKGCTMSEANLFDAFSFYTRVYCDFILQGWYKNHKIWKHFADYFPMRLVKTADLPPDKNYIIW